MQQKRKGISQVVHACNCAQCTLNALEISVVKSSIRRAPCNHTAIRIYADYARPFWWAVQSPIQPIARITKRMPCCLITSRPLTIPPLPPDPTWIPCVTATVKYTTGLTWQVHRNARCQVQVPCNGVTVSERCTAVHRGRIVPTVIHTAPPSTINGIAPEASLFTQQTSHLG